MRRQARALVALALAGACALTGCGGSTTVEEAADTTEAATETQDAAEPQDMYENPETAATQVERSATDTLIDQMIVYRGCYGEAADGKVAELLGELSAADERQGALWGQIMDLWSHINTDTVVNADVLPEGLPEDGSMAICVLGFELNDDGTMKDELVGRLEVALASAEQYPASLVVCTGGGTAKNNPEATEGGLMGQWMVEHGLDESRLIVEDKSHTTAENARFSYEILRAEHPEVTSVTLVSSSYHIAWGSLLFQSEFWRIASEQQTEPLTVISNAAYMTENPDYRLDEMDRWETGGMLQLAGNTPLAMTFYRNVYEVPEL